MALAQVVSAGDGAGQRPPVFDSGVGLVLVDVVVTDRSHRPVLGLDASDFRVFEDGTAHAIVSFAAFGPVAGEPRPRPGAPEGAGAPPAAPLHFVQASTVVLVDEPHMSPDEAVRAGPALARVLGGLTDRQGWVLVLAPWSNIALAGRLPQDRDRLAEAVRHVRGRRFPQLGTYPMTDAEALEIDRGDTSTTNRVLARFRALNPGLPREMESLVRTRAAELADAARGRRRGSFEALRLAFSWLAKMPGRHGVLLVTSGFPNDPSDPHFERVVTESLKVNAPVHFLDVGSPSPQGMFEGAEFFFALPLDARVSPFEAADASSGSDVLAQSTGGLRVAADAGDGLARILDTTRSYYVIGYEPARTRPPGFRKIKVEVRGRGRRILARRGYFQGGPPETAPR